LLSLLQIRELLKNNERASHHKSNTVIQKNDLLRYHRRIVLAFLQVVVSHLKKIIDFLKTPHSPTPHTQEIRHYLTLGKNNPDTPLWDFYMPSKNELMLDYITRLLPPPLLQQEPRTPPPCPKSSSSKNVPSAPVKRKRPPQEL
jgi:hypothetical protein